MRSKVLIPAKAKIRGDFFQLVQALDKVISIYIL